MWYPPILSDIEDLRGLVWFRLLDVPLLFPAALDGCGNGTALPAFARATMLQVKSAVG